ncbi:MAG TPA: hypothetical protein DFR83_05015, partial [Deltaproteobacteria bacterium]|nr:hypothetical protein [Deltaproteobacteria bacterium]
AATEICNGIDDDCVNGADDDDPAVDLSTGTTYYRDADSDRYGDTNVDNAITACDLPEGYTTAADALDCDDSTAAVNPDATEVCNGIDDDCNTDVDDDDAGVSYGRGDLWYEDNDIDTYGNASSSVSSCAQPSGYVRDDTDCDDSRDDVNPGEVEICDDDDTDEDCNRQADDDDAGVTGVFTDFYLDDDGDTFGDPAVSVSQCDAPARHVLDDTDCDDTDDTINTAATEVCDALNVDEDCDELSDDDDPSASAATFSRFYRDNDNDTYGDPSDSTNACDAPSDYVSDNQDCDDANENVNPAATEVCNGIDDDCVNGADDDDVNVDPSTFSTFYLDDDDDGYGLDSTTLDACASPSGYTDLSGDCDDDADTTFPGATETCNDGIDADCEPTTCLLESGDLDSTADVAWRGESSSDAFGHRVLLTPDLTGDGNPDAIASAYFESFGSASPKNFAGRVRVGASLETTDLDDGTDSVVNAEVIISGDSNADRMGTGLSSGDFNGDGNEDLVLGAVFAEESGNGADGAAYLLLGPLNSSPVPVGTSDAITYGRGNGDNLGWASAAGDIDGDAYADLAVAAPQCSASSFVASNVGTSSGPGEVFVLSGAASTSWFDTALGATTGIRFTGTSSGDCAGHSLVFADVDGNGQDELIVGAPFAGTGGEVHVADTTLTGANDLSDEITMGAWGANHEVGSAIATDDMNGDGYADLLVGAPESDLGGNAAGAAFVVLGPTTGETELTEADMIMVGERTDDQAGSAVSVVPDVDVDGSDDLLIGAASENTAGSDAGAAYLVLGFTSGTLDLVLAEAKVLGSAADDRLGTSVAGLGDVDGDGSGDVIVGAPFATADTLQDGGESKLILGGGWP